MTLNIRISAERGTISAIFRFYLEQLTDCLSCEVNINTIEIDGINLSDLNSLVIFLRNYEGDLRLNAIEE